MRYPARHGLSGARTFGTSPGRPARSGRLVAIAGLIALLAGLLPAGTIAPVLANHTAVPTSVTIAGSLQEELGCPGDWQPECAATHLAFDATDQAWQGSFAVPAGTFEYKAPLNDAWDENYGANATSNGVNAYSIGADACNFGDAPVSWVGTTNQQPVIAQNLYRMKNGRFVDLGQGWFKHGHSSANASKCSKCLEPRGGNAFFGEEIGGGIQDVEKAHRGNAKG